MVQSITVNTGLGGIGSEADAWSLMIAIKSPGECPRRAADTFTPHGSGNLVSSRRVGSSRSCGRIPGAILHYPPVSHEGGHSSCQCDDS